MFIFMKSRPQLKMGHVGLKTRSLCQFLEKNYVHTLEGIHVSDCHELLSDVYLNKI